MVTAARLMHKFNAHGATDVTGFGLLGHAKNLASIQKNEVSFVIHNLPVIAKMAAISKACGNMFGLLQGQSAETSGLNFLFSTLPLRYCNSMSAVTCDLPKHSYCKTLQSVLTTE